MNNVGAGTKYTSKENYLLRWEYFDRLPLEVKEILWETESAVSPVAVYPFVICGYSISEIKRILKQNATQVRIKAYGPKINEGLLP